MEEKGVLGHLEQRLTLIQAKIKDLFEQRDEIDHQIKKYKELMRYYRGVYEADTITWAVSEILTESSPLRVEQIVQLIMKRYPDIADRAKDLFHSVEVACLRGVREGIYERVARRCYGIKKKEEDE